MPVVLVHGVPETPAIWDPLRSHLTRDDVVALQLPGFGTPWPDGFTASKEEYVAWLVEALAGLDADGSVDIVGHDWGAGFVVRVVSIRPDLVRSWATDAPRFGHADFEWHELAKIWQTPGAGEEFFRTQLAVPQHERGGIFEAFGVPPDEAVSMGAAVDQTMADSILALYRSALDVGREWAPDFRDIPAPGLALLPLEDPFLIPDVDPGAAANAGAQVAELAGVGHWWMLQDPAQGAEALEEFWTSASANWPASVSGPRSPASSRRRNDESPNGPPPVSPTARLPLSSTSARRPSKRISAVSTPNSTSAPVPSSDG